MAVSSRLYDQIVVVTETYLGPASERFINRQITNHLQKQPTTLRQADLPDLVEWIRVTISVLTEDSQMIDRYIDELEALIQPSRRQNG